MTALTAIYVAQHLTREVADRDAGVSIESSIDTDYLARIGKHGRLEEWANIAAIVSEKYRELTDS